MSTDWQHGCEGSVYGGDYNSRWSAGEAGGQRAIESWANENYLINGPKLIAERGNMTFYTYGRTEWAGGSWIDHLLHAGDPAIFDILGAFNDVGSLLDGISDHKPLIGVYKTSPPMVSEVTAMPKPRKRPELPRGDKRQIADFQHRISDVLSQVPDTVTNRDEAEEALEYASQFIVKVTRDMNEAYGKRNKKFKDGFSPEFVLRKFHLAAVINIKRHIFRHHGATPWISYTVIRRNIQLVYDTLQRRAQSLGLSQPNIDRILNVQNTTLDYWMSLTTGPTEAQLDLAIKTLRNKMHGRARTDMRLAQKGYMSFIETMRERGRLKVVIKAMLGANAGRRHQDGLKLDNLT